MVVSQERVLIIDDEEMIRLILNKKLSREGYHCEESGSSEEALKKLGSKPTELAILDINMPGKPGTELLPEIRADFPETAVIMASAVTDTKVIAQCIKDGAEDYIRKPFSLDEARLLVFTLESNDKYLAGHSRRTTEIALAIGRDINLPREVLEDLQLGALLHDIGKIAVDPGILNKPGKLTPEEYRHIMAHTVAGSNIVKPMVNKRIADIISHHHDHYDGSGLGQVAAGKDIPLGARILAVADAFDAMTSERPYRAGMSNEEAIEEIRQGRGTQFDPV